MSAPRATVSPRLLRSYRATRYQVGPVVLRIGRRSPGMDAILAQLGARTGVLITAWNPFSRRMPIGWNQRMQQRLQQHLGRRPTLPASGTLGGWHEVHVLVAGNPRPTVRLAKLFRQTAVVAVARNQPARLVFPPREALNERQFYLFGIKSR